MTVIRVTQHKKQKAPMDWAQILTGTAAVLGAIAVLIQALRAW